MSSTSGPVMARSATEAFSTHEEFDNYLDQISSAINNALLQYIIFDDLCFADLIVDFNVLNTLQFLPFYNLDDREFSFAVSN